MPVKKGNIPWNKGLQSPATSKRMKENNPMKRLDVRKKMSQSQKGRIPWNKGTKGICKPNSGSFKKGIIPWSKSQKGIHYELRIKFNNAIYRILLMIVETSSWLLHIFIKKTDYTPQKEIDIALVRRKLQLNQLDISY